MCFECGEIRLGIDFIWLWKVPDGLFITGLLGWALVCDELWSLIYNTKLCQSSALVLEHLKTVWWLWGSVLLISGLEQVLFVWWKNWARQGGNFFVRTILTQPETLSYEDSVHLSSDDIFGGWFMCGAATVTVVLSRVGFLSNGGHYCEWLWTSTVHSELYSVAEALLQN